MSASGGGRWGPTIIRRITRVEVPDWIEDNTALRRLGGLSAGAAATLVTFAEGPREFILSIVLEAIVGMILGFGEWAVGVVRDVWAPLAGIPATVFGPVIDGYALAESSIMGVISVVNGAVITLATLAGPASPIVLVVIWAVAGVVVAYLGRLLIYEILPLVIPWL